MKYICHFCEKIVDEKDIIIYDFTTEVKLCESCWAQFKKAKDEQIDEWVDKWFANCEKKKKRTFQKLV